MFLGSGIPTDQPSFTTIASWGSGSISKFFKWDPSRQLMSQTSQGEFLSMGMVWDPYLCMYIHGYDSVSVKRQLKRPTKTTGAFAKLRKRFLLLVWILSFTKFGRNLLKNPMGAKYCQPEFLEILNTSRIGEEKIVPFLSSGTERFLESSKQSVQKSAPRILQVVLNYNFIQFLCALSLLNPLE